MKSWLRKRPSKIVVGSLAAALVGVIGVTLLIKGQVNQYQRRHQAEPERIGVSFSTKYARELNLDWQSALTALLDQVGARDFRLMSYWDEIEPESGTYNWADLDRQFAMVGERSGRVSLAIGLRQPRYPECHQPRWAVNLPESDFRPRLNKFIAAVVSRYKDHPELVSWQLENEALNRSFGHCKDFNRNRLEQEYQVVKQIDLNHPVIISTADQIGIPVGSPRGDIVGFSVYRRVNNSLLGYLPVILPSWWHGLRAALTERFLQRPVMIHELQAEPWGPRATVDLPLAEQDRSMNASQLKANVSFARHTGIKQIYLWGGEWWYWRLTKAGDPSLWQAAAEVFKN